MLDINSDYVVIMFIIVIIIGGILIASIYNYKRLLALENKKFNSLKEKNDDFQQMLSIFDEMVWFCDISEDRWWFNDKIYTSFGYKKINEHLTFEEFYNLIHIKDRQKVFDLVKNGAMSDKFKITIRILNAKKFYQWVHMIGQRVVNENNKVIKISGMIMDVTSIVATENALQNAVQTLAQTKNMNTTFLTRMSHEIRTPLNAISGYVQLLERENLLEGQKNQLKKIRIATDQLLGIMSEIIEAGRIESKEISIQNELINISDLIGSLKEEFESTAIIKKLNYNIIYENDPNYSIYIDGERLKQILFNLISNSIQFTPKGYVLVKIEINEKAFNRVLLDIVVEDSGLGFKDKNILSILNGRSNLDSKDALIENGLGLLMTYNLMKLLGGQIQVESHEGFGTNFKLSFEVTKGELKKATKKNLIKESYQKLYNDIKGPILLAEDNELNQLLIVDMLHMLSIYNIDIAKDGKEAIEMFQDKKYQMIITDIQMPHIGGEQLAKYVRRSNESIPIVAITANTLDSQVASYYKSGISDIISKPIEMAELKAVLSKFLELGYDGNLTMI